MAARAQAKRLPSPGSGSSRGSRRHHRQLTRKVFICNPPAALGNTSSFAAGQAGLPPEFGSNPQTRRVQLEFEKWRSVCAARVEDDLIVLPELLEKPTGVLGTTCSRSFPHDFLNGVRAVDCGEDPLQCRINRKGEIGVGVGPIDQHGRKAGWYPLADAEGPR